MIRSNSQIQKTLGSELIMMNCNGKIYPLLNGCNFDIVLFGSEGKGKVNVKAEYSKNEN